MAPDAALCAALLAIDPVGVGGAALRAPAGPLRDDWLVLLRRLLPAQTPVRRIPLNINDTALLGGLDLGATLHTGRPVAQPGVLAQADGGLVLLAMAERVSLGTAARLAAVLDTQCIALQRDGLAVRQPVRLGLIALDEGASDDEQMPAALLDRLAFHGVLTGPADSQPAVDWQAVDIVRARAFLPTVSVPNDVLAALCATALALGINSLRAPLLALRVARAAAALAGCRQVGEDHATLAARLVLAPRATQLPTTEDNADNDALPNPPADPPPNPSEDPPQPDPDTGPDNSAPDLDEAQNNIDKPLAEIVLEAAQAAIPPGLLAALKIGDATRARTKAAGRSGAVQKSQLRGRPLGARRGEPRAGARLNVIETLRAAAPWQRLRQQAAQLHKPQRILVRREDFHVTRFKQVGQTTTLFVVDASGSSAMNRLAEAKGAVELLLADCYVRRDRVSVLAFRGTSAELLLPPTRSLARAKRALAALPGGGGTPLATAIDAARGLADQISRRGEAPIVVLLTDGRGNIARDGTPGRAQAGEDALAAARQVRLAQVTCLLMDTAPQPQPAAQVLALAMGATYVPLPYAGAQVLSKVVQGVRAAISPITQALR